MKPKSIKSLLALALLAPGVLFAQTTAKTTPVGYVTSKIAANASLNPEGSATFISASLYNPTVYAGQSTVAPSAKTITLPTGVPTDFDGTYMLEISDGSQEGWWSTIVGSTSSTIEVADTFPASLSTNVKVTVRKFTTIQDIFGENAPGLASFSNEEPYDEIQVLDPVTQGASSIIRIGSDWIDAVSEEAAENVIVYPGTAVKVIHRANTDLSVVVSGEVKATKTQVDVFQNDNWIGQVNATGATFDFMNLGSQLLSTDIANIIREDAGGGQSTDEFVAVSELMFNAVSEENAEEENILAGNGLIVRRPQGEAAPITIPAQPVAQ